MPPSPSRRDCATAWRLLEEHRPGWRWYLTDIVPPNGQYWADLQARPCRLWLPGYLRGAAALRAFLAGAEALLGDDATLKKPHNVVPIHNWASDATRTPRRRRASGRVG